MLARKLAFTSLIGLAVGLGCAHSSSRRPAQEASYDYQNHHETIESSSSNTQFDWPVDSAKLSRGYSEKPVGKGRHKRAHWGVDLAAHKGSPILSAQEGSVIYTGKDFRGYGKMILIEGKNGWATLYAHLSKISISEGDFVSRGQKIAEMGSTGRSTGSHLHFEIRHNRTPVDPLLYMPNGQLLVILKQNKSRLLAAHEDSEFDDEGIE